MSIHFKKKNKSLSTADIFKKIILDKEYEKTHIGKYKQKAKDDLFDMILSLNMPGFLLIDYVKEYGLLGLIRDIALFPLMISMLPLTLTLGTGRLIRDTIESSPMLMKEAKDYLLQRVDEILHHKPHAHKRRRELTPEEQKRVEELSDVMAKVEKDMEEKEEKQQKPANVFK